MSTHISFKGTQFASGSALAASDVATVAKERLRLSKGTAVCSRPYVAVCTDDKTCWELTKDEYYRIRHLLTNPIEELDGEL